MSTHPARPLRARPLHARPLHARTLIVGAALALAAPVLAAPAAAQVADPLGDFLPTYEAGPLNPDLDVRSVGFTFNGVSTFRFISTLAGPIGTTPGAAFVWGVNRGAPVADFAHLGLPGIVFDGVVVVIPDGTSVFIDLAAGAPPVPLAPGAVSFSGNRLVATVPLSLLPSTGFAPDEYEANLWPRSAFDLRDEFISDFAPDATNLRVAVIPEPATLALVGSGLLLLGAGMRRRR